MPLTVNVDNLLEGVDSARDHVASLNAWACEFDKLKRCGELLGEFSAAIEHHWKELEKLSRESELAFEQARSRGALLGDSAEYRELLERVDDEISELYNDAEMYRSEFEGCAEVYMQASSLASAKFRASATALFDAFPVE